MLCANCNQTATKSQINGSDNKKALSEFITKGLFLLLIYGTLGANRTRDTRIRNPVLYPLSYEGTL